MTGYSLKLFTRKNTFKKEAENCKKSHAKGSAAAKANIIDAVLENRSEAASSTDEETLESSSCANHGFLIAPIPRKAADFTPPNSMFVDVPKRSGGRYKQHVKKMLPWKLGYSSKRSSNSSKSSPQIQSTLVRKH